MINNYVEKKRGDDTYIPTLKEDAPDSDFFRLASFKIDAPTTCMSYTGVLSITFKQDILNFNRINCERTLDLNLKLSQKDTTFKKVVMGKGGCQAKGRRLSQHGNTWALRPYET